MREKTEYYSKFQTKGPLMIKNCRLTKGPLIIIDFTLLFHV